MVLYSGLLALLFIVCKDFADIVALRFASPTARFGLDLTSRRFFYGFQVVTTPLFIMTCGMWSEITPLSYQDSQLMST
jgi:ACS family allantoate permease-like MFS transporter